MGIDKPLSNQSPKRDKPDHDTSPTEPSNQSPKPDEPDHDTSPTEPSNQSPKPDEPDRDTTLAKPSSNESPKRDEPDSNTRLLYRGAILGALITGVCVCLAAIAQSTLSPLLVRSTVTPSPTPTPITPTPTLTPTPSSPAEAALIQYLSALRDGASDPTAFARTSSLVSDYSLEFLAITRRELEVEYQSQIEKQTFLRDFKVIGSDPLDDDGVHFDIVWTVEEAGSLKRTDKAFTVHKDIDGVWRVNESGLVDYRRITAPVISDATTGLSIQFLTLERYETYLIIPFELIASPTGHMYFTLPATPWCQFGSRAVSGTFDNPNSAKWIYFDGFVKDYPISCTFPDLDNEPGFNKRWKAPTMVFNYE